MIIKRHPLTIEHKAKLSLAHKGKKHTAQHIANNVASRKAGKGYNPTTETKAKMKANHKGFTGRNHTPETKSKISIARTGMQFTPSHIENIRKAVTGTKHSLEHRIKMSTLMKGRILTPEWKAKIGLANKNRCKLPEEVVINKRPSVTIETRMKISLASRKQYASPEARIKHGLILKKAWENLPQEEKDKRIQKIRLAMNCKPNYPEYCLFGILEMHYPGEWQYTGDGQVVIAGKNPDFINVNGRKLVIELFGDYWHNSKITGVSELEDMKAREMSYTKYGYRTLIIWQKELRQPSKVLDKVDTFIHSYDNSKHNET